MPANMTAWNICLTHDPVYAGLYRSVNDFATALPAKTLSFDDGRLNRSNLSAIDGAKRLDCGPGWLARDCYRLPAVAARSAEQLVADAELLVVHSMFRAHAPWAADWARRHDRPYWAVPHGCLDPWGLAQKRIAKQAWLQWYGRNFLANASRIIFSTQRELEKARPWLEHCGATGRAVVVHWPVPLPAVDGRSAVRVAFRSRHGIPMNAPLLLYVGRLHTMKRPLQTVAAFCAAGRADAHLVIIGMDGDLCRQDIERTVDKRCKGCVHVIGPLAGAELASAWLAGDGFISLSWRENFGYSAAEAVAHGLPVILSRGHDLAADMPSKPDGRFACGWLLDDDSIRASASAISEWVAVIAAAGPRLEAMAAVGRAWAAEALAPAEFARSLAYLRVIC
jgi:glycosyltransferase involved in cell wall biosynthesis